MKVTKILGALLLVGLIIGLGNKLMVSLSLAGDSTFAVFSVIVAGILLALGFRRIIRD